jgi:hypothetical protein
MKITLKDGGREEHKLLKLVTIGRFKNATDATEAAINLLYQKVLAEEMQAGVGAQRESHDDVDLFRLQGLTDSQLAERARDDEDEAPAPRVGGQGAKLSTKPG